MSDKRQVTAPAPLASDYSKFAELGAGFHTARSFDYYL